MRTRIMFIPLLILTTCHVASAKFFCEDVVSSGEFCTNQDECLAIIPGQDNPQLVPSSYLDKAYKFDWRRLVRCGDGTIRDVNRQNYCLAQSESDSLALEPCVFYPTRSASQLWSYHDPLELPDDRGLVQLWHKIKNNRTRDHLTVDRHRPTERWFDNTKIWYNFHGRGAVKKTGILQDRESGLCLTTSSSNLLARMAECDFSSANQTLEMFENGEIVVNKNRQLCSSRSLEVVGIYNCHSAPNDFNNESEADSNWIIPEEFYVGEYFSLRSKTLGRCLTALADGTVNVTSCVGRATSSSGGSKKGGRPRRWRGTSLVATTTAASSTT